MSPAGPELLAAALAADLHQTWLASMRRGNFAAAWRVSDIVLRRRDDAMNDALPSHERLVWRGEAITGRHVFVQCYHGLGDTVQFLRLLPRLTNVAASVTVRLQPELVEIAHTLPGAENINFDPGASLDGHDAVELEIMELAHVFRLTAADLPGPVPYLHAGGAAISPDTEPRVGLVWRAGDWDNRRSLPDEALETWTQVPGIHWVVLQQNYRGGSGLPSLFRPTVRRNVMETAALMQELDVVISVDSFPAHLAGALGRPTWTLLCAEPDWRWMEQRSDSLWYPTMRLFRQAHAGDWSAVVNAVARALAALVAAASRAPSATVWCNHAQPCA